MTGRDDMTPAVLVSRLYRRLWASLPESAQFLLDGVEAAGRGQPHLIRHLT